MNTDQAGKLSTVGTTAVQVITGILTAAGVANPAVIAAESIIALAIRYGPQLVVDIETAFSKSNVAPQDVVDMLSNIPSFDDLVKAANLRAGKPADNVIPLQP